jgi:hypothetical protein
LYSLRIAPDPGLKAPIFGRFFRGLNRLRKKALDQAVRKGRFGRG